MSHFENSICPIYVCMYIPEVWTCLAEPIMPNHISYASVCLSNQANMSGSFV